MRTVGDVLNKVDRSNSSEEFARAVDRHYASWKSEFDPVSPTRKDFFWAFIKKERDQLLHAYETDVYRQSDIALLVTASSSTEGHERFVLNENLFRPLVVGPWAGEDARDILLEAIEWWEDQLDQIDGSVS